jgi:hypothetical protein
MNAQQQQSATWIFVANVTTDEVFSGDQSGEMTTEQASAIANRFMDLFVEKIEAAYPDADIEIGQGNGLDHIKVQDDHGRESEIVDHLDAISTAIWESDDVWSAGA